MTNPNVYAANLQWFGMALETTPGTPIATPAQFVAVDSPVYKLVPQLLVDTNLRGSMAAEYEQLNGLFYSTFGMKTNMYLDSSFVFFRQILGLPDVLTGASDPYTHKTSLQNGNGGQPAGTTLFWNDAAGKVYQVPGAVQSECKVTLKDSALAQLDLSYVGLPAAAITPPTLTQSALLPAPSWNVTTVIGGVGSSSYSEIDLDIKRAAEMVPTISGSQTPVGIFGGPVSVSGSLTAYYQGYAADVHVQDQIANTQPTLTVQVNPVGDAVHYIKFQLTQVVFDSVEVTGTNKWMEVKANFKGLANPTDVAGGGNQSPILVTGLLPTSTAL